MSSCEDASLAGLLVRGLPSTTTTHTHPSLKHRPHDRPWLAALNTDAHLPALSAVIDGCVHQGAGCALPDTPSPLTQFVAAMRLAPEGSPGAPRTAPLTHPACATAGQCGAARQALETALYGHTLHAARALQMEGWVGALRWGRGVRGAEALDTSQCTPLQDGPWWTVM